MAFSGRVDDNGLDFTEAGMNGFPESQTPTRFNDPEYGVLIVAEKFQTGYDQPLLHTMFVDKTLVGLVTVQTLSRLNRIHPEKTDTFVPDFRNQAEDVTDAFRPWYEATVAVPTDPNLLHDLADRLLVLQVLDPAEARAVAARIVDRTQKVTDHGVVFGLLDPDGDVVRCIRAGQVSASDDPGLAAARARDSPPGRGARSEGDDQRRAVHRPFRPRRPCPPLWRPVRLGEGPGHHHPRHRLGSAAVRLDDPVRRLPVDALDGSVGGPQWYGSLPAAISNRTCRSRRSSTPWKPATARSAMDAELGICVFAYTGGNKGKPLPQKLAALFDPHDGGLRCLIESDYLSWVRTGATSGVATRHLARPESSVVGILGAGKQARSQLLAIAAVRPIERAVVYSLRHERREAFAAEMTERCGFPVVAVDDAAAVLEAADIVCTATNSPGPVLDGTRLRPGTHVNAIGQHYPDRRELDTEAVVRSRIIVDDLGQALRDYGELLIPIAAGELGPDHVQASLGDVVCGTAAGRTSADDITVLLSGGIAAEYLAAAHAAWRLAEAAGLGTEVDLYDKPPAISLAVYTGREGEEQAALL